MKQSTKTVRYQAAKRITLIGAFTNLMLATVKLIGGWLYRSNALVADGIHSLSDLITDAMVLFASKYGSQDADPTHPYGHQRIETAATLLLSLALLIVGAAIIWDAFSEILQKTNTIPSWGSIPIAALSILMNEILFHWTRRVGERIESELIIVNAWHHRSDAASSIVVLIGLIGNIAGIPYLDATAAIVVGGMIGKMGIDYGWKSIKELIDTSVDPILQTQISQTIQQIHGVLKLHQLRTRSMGGDIYIDVHIQVSPWISVSEGHYIAQNVHYVLMKTFNKIKDVTVHVDPEDDETNPPSTHLPNRATLEKTLIHPWKQQHPEITEWDIHYLNGTIILDLMIDARGDKKTLLHLINISLTQKKHIKVRTWWYEASS